MPKAFLASVIHRVSDPIVDRILRNLDQRIRELAGVRIVQGILKEDIDLADGTEVQITHGLGRPARWLVCRLLNPSSTGRIEEIVSSTVDRSSVLTLKATGYTATIAVDLWIF